MAVGWRPQEHIACITTSCVAAQGVLRQIACSPRSGRAGQFSTTLVRIAGLGQIAQESVLLAGDLINREHAEQEYQLHGDDAEIAQADSHQDTDGCAEPGCLDRPGYPDANPCA